MVNKCVVFGCKSGYVCKSVKETKVFLFSFPLNNPELLKKWIKFVNRSNWKPTSNSVVCAKHFKEEFINPGKRTKLKWELDPVPTIHTSAALEVPSALPTSCTSRKSPKEREYQKDELAQFGKQDKITNFDDITENHAPDNYQFYKALQCIVFYNLVFSVTSGFPAVYGAIKLTKNCMWSWSGVENLCLCPNGL